MNKAVAADQPSQVEADIAAAGEAMMLLITRSTWETLLIQGRAEGLGPGEVLSKAIRLYLESHGSPEAVQYLNAVAAAGGH